ncbi:hypothetical protein T440DRAFT_467687 [Plenodomus tracheiphilus IPT5]|uniref:Uncharacterized protein n=1 Tax=Plenodomus tracheiphilus IPT5 TaxID=1408161 RepID=A0A6A7B7F4_9PLEO|nr:hypothetical protein T440DRAFT_467687 [Plenodomus tracheiphilus IPT5]
MAYGQLGPVAFKARSRIARSNMQLRGHQNHKRVLATELDIARIGSQFWALQASEPQANDFDADIEITKHLSPKFSLPGRDRPSAKLEIHQASLTPSVLGRVQWETPIDRFQRESHGPWSPYESKVLGVSDLITERPTITHMSGSSTPLLRGLQRNPKSIGPAKSANLSPKTIERKVTPRGGHNHGPYILDHMANVLDIDWKHIRSLLPENWMWDVEYAPSRDKNPGCWVCTPMEVDVPRILPLRIADAPVVLPVEHQWPPTSGVTPPPDPHSHALIDCCMGLSLEVAAHIFDTYDGCIGFYVLISGHLHVIVPENFNRIWATSHLPHRYGGLRVSYIAHDVEPTTLSQTSETPFKSRKSPSVFTYLKPKIKVTSGQVPLTVATPRLQINDFIQARPKSNHRSDVFMGKAGLKVNKEGQSLLLMSTHVITEAIISRSHRDSIIRGDDNDRLRRLKDDWNKHVEIWTGDEKIGQIEKTFDPEAGFYPHGFRADITLINPTNPASIDNVSAAMPNLGWLNDNSWASLLQQTSPLKFLGSTEKERQGKTIKCGCPSDILVVGQGILLNQSAVTAAAGKSKKGKSPDTSAWKSLISRAILYRVHPDFDPPTGYSGAALYADGTREDGSEGPGIVGFQSFVQRSGHVQDFDMEGPALEQRLKRGRVAFYGAFEVPTELKEYTIM